MVKSSIILDNQSFDLQFEEDKKYSNWWLRFGRRNYPLRGKRILSRIKDVSGVQEVRIFLRNAKLYCKLTYVEEVQETIADPAKSTGLDLNVNNISTTDKKYSLKRWIHRKKEYRKGKGKKNIENYTKNVAHILANQIIEDLIFREQEVLVLENLKGLRKSSSKKNGTSKGKTVNYLVNNAFPYAMFRSILGYKCLENGIKVVAVHPANTSKGCSRCGSLETERLHQSRFHCLDCGLQLDADLNAARNILMRYTAQNEPHVNPARPALAASSCRL